KLEGAAVVIAVQDFDFMGGSLGMAAGEAIVRGLELALEKKSPFIVFAASGGARMQEGILSLMQMPRTTVAVQMLREAKLPYIVVLTNPTTGGVTASYAMLGDVQIAEPGALIGFAGARVIEQTIREKLPEGFQRAEYLRDHGMVDMVVHRHEMRPTLARLCRLLTKSPALEAASLRVHAYTSPYLVRLNECCRLGRAGGGVLVGDDELKDALERCERANAGAPITVFEIKTAAAFVVFAQNPADALLLEVGLGGRLDATNTVEKPLASVIAPVSMDHTEFLGSTLTSIAAEKAAIIKRGVPVISAEQAPEVMAVIEAQASRLRAPLFAAGQEWHVGIERGRLVYQDDRGLMD